jgi:hypothetical protein
VQQVSALSVQRTIIFLADLRKRQVSALEQEIDELVYALYGLTPEEIKIVEGAAK